jgi:hypothetical protein
MSDNYFSCNIPCAESCLPCNRKCTYTCKHSRCSRKCGQPCIPCKVRVSTCFVCTLYDLFVCHIEGKTQAGGVQEWYVEEGVEVSEGELTGDCMVRSFVTLCYLYVFCCVNERYKLWQVWKPIYTAVMVTFSVQGYVDCSCIPDCMLLASEQPLSSQLQGLFILNLSTLVRMYYYGINWLNHSFVVIQYITVLNLSNCYSHIIWGDCSLYNYSELLDVDRIQHVNINFI